MVRAAEARPHLLRTFMLPCFHRGNLKPDCMGLHTTHSPRCESWWSSIAASAGSCHRLVNAWDAVHREIRRSYAEESGSEIRELYGSSSSFPYRPGVATRRDKGVGRCGITDASRVIVCIQCSTFNIHRSGSLSISTSAGHGSGFLRAMMTPGRVSARESRMHDGP